MDKKPILQEIEEQQHRGVFLILTGPTGAGKDAVFGKLMAQDASIKKIITTVSRPMRNAESEGNPYHFITREVFEQMIANGDFFEWVEFREHLYGTEKRVIEEALATKKDVIWHIEAKGVKNIKQKIKDMVPRSVFIFLTAPSVMFLEERVKKDEGTEVIHRWNEPLVKWEMDQYDDCDYLVVNEEGKLDETVEKIKAIMEARRQEIIK